MLVKSPALFAGGLWAIALIILALALPSGLWTIDDGVKLIAQDSGTGIWNDVLPDGPVRSRMADPAAFPPLHPPFAARADNGFALGFSPWSRAFIGALLSLGLWGRLLSAMAGIALWLWLHRRGFAFGFLLLPLTFYALVPWEHLWSWLLLWPALDAAFVRERAAISAHLLAGSSLALAILLRPETGILAALLPIFLGIRGRRREAVALTASAILVIASALFVHAATSSQSAFAQLQLNVLGKSAVNPQAWLANRPLAVYKLLFAMDANTLWSVLQILLILGGVLLIYVSERGVAENWFPARIGIAASAAGIVLIASAFGVWQYRLWASPLPPLALLKSGSLLVAAPWSIASFLPPFRGRPAFHWALIAIAIALMLTPVWSGVHWGPRVLLFVLPLLLVDVVQTGRIRSRLFTVLIAVTALQTAASGALVWARMDEQADHIHRLRELSVGTPVVCPTMSQCVDLAPLWPGREFFTAADFRERRQLFIELRFAGVDTVWLHTGIADPLHEKSLPGATLYTDTRTDTFTVGSIYRTAWRVRQIALNRSDPRWATELEAEAGQLMIAGENLRALRLQQAAVAANPASASAHHNLALLYARLGQKEEARAATRHALELDSTLEQPRQLLNLLNADSAGAP